MRGLIFAVFCWAVAIAVACTSSMEGGEALSAKEFEKAAAAYERQVSKHPEDLRSTILLGYARYKSGDPERALAVFRRVLEQEPVNPYGLFYAGLAALSLGDPEQALSYWGEYTTGQRFLKKAVEGQIALLRQGKDRPDFDPAAAAAGAEQAMDEAYANQKPEDECVERMGVIHSGDCSRQGWMPEAIPYLP